MSMIVILRTQGIMLDLCCMLSATMWMQTQGIEVDGLDNYIHSEKATNQEACKNCVIATCEVSGDQ
jgi:hypothetical protein